MVKGILGLELAAHFAVALCALLPAHAENHPADARTSAGYLILGLGTPVGATGLEAVHLVAPWLELSAGLGLAFPRNRDDSRDLQWAVTPRLVTRGRHRLTIGAGVSGGNFAYSCNRDGALDCNMKRYAIWANLELGGELWGDQGFAFRYFAGLATELTPGATSGMTMDRTTLPYSGVGFGYAF